jgi:phosphoribosylanthranilate isomerase
VTLVKICGIRSLEDGRAALEAGANLLGFVFWKPGKRYISAEHAATIIDALRTEASDWSAVGVFVDASVQDVTDTANLCQLDYVQLSGNEPAEVVRAMPRPTLKALHVRTGQELLAADIVHSNALGAQLYLLDTHADSLPGGTGVAFDWAALRGVGPRCLVAGGLRPDNVGAALDTLAPLGVDVSSGVEYPDGASKDPRLVRAFLEAVRKHDDLSARIG